MQLELINKIYKHFSIIRYNRKNNKKEKLIIRPLTRWNDPNSFFTINNYKRKNRTLKYKKKKILVIWT